MVFTNLRKRLSSFKLGRLTRLKLGMEVAGFKHRMETRQLSVPQGRGIRELARKKIT